MKSLNLPIISAPGEARELTDQKARQLLYMITKTGLSALLLIILLPGCKKDKLGDLGKKQQQATEKQDFSYLGKGYDITGEYANPSATRFGVIDVDALFTALPNRVSKTDMSSQESTSTAGEDAVSYSRALSATVKTSILGNFFKGNLNYVESLDLYSDEIFADYRLSVTKKHLKLNATLEILKNYLTSEFKSDLQTQTPQYLVEHYGTHVLSDIILGAQFQVFYRAETSSSDRKGAASAGLSSAIKDIFSLKMSGDINESLAEKNSEQKLYYRTIGGNASISLVGEIDLTANVADKIQLTQWQASIAPDNAELIDFGSADGLILLSDLIADPAKAKAVRSYINKYLLDNQVQIVDPPAQVYEYFDYDNGHHAYSLANVPAINGNYRMVGPAAFKGYDKAIQGAVAVYQYYSADKNDFCYSLNGSAGPAGYANTGIVFYEFATQAPGTQPVFEYYYEEKSKKKMYYDHYYSEDNTIPGPNWYYMGIAFYAFP